MKVKELAIIILMISTLMILGTKAEATTGKINSETVRLRKEPNTSSTIVEQLDKDLEVEIIEEEDSWYKIKTKVNGESITGYVSKKLVDTNDNNDAKTEENVTTSDEATKAPIETETKVDQTNPEIALYEDNVDIAEPTTTTVDTTNEIKENEQYSLSQETALKIVPLINSKARTKISGNVKVIEIINDWCRIENDTESGWVRKSSLQQISEEQPIVEEQTQTEQTTTEQQETPEVTEDTSTTNTTEEKEETTSTVKEISKTGYVTAESLMVRKEASASSEDLDSLSKNDKVQITGQVDGWYQIKINGKTGYVSAKYISDTKVAETTSRSGSTIKEEKVTPMEVEETTSSTTSNSNKGTSVVEYAKNYLGCKYVSGGSSPSTGFDCSGFTSYVYKNFGVSLSRSSKGQINDGVAVSRSDLQPGDIVVFNNSGNTAIGHVGIYIGGDNFIHAANPSQGVTITSLSSSYYGKRYVGARRVN